MPERLGPLDASFLYLEEPHLPMHVGGLALFDPGAGPRGPIRIDRLRELTATRLHQVPRFRQRVLFPPASASRPVWADDPDLDLDHHVRHLALPRPGSPRQLEDLVAQLHSQPLDRRRPLWEMYLVDGLEDGYQAIVSKTHHAMVDGVGGMDLCTVLFDLTPEPQDPVAHAWTPGRPPSRARLLADALADRVLEPAGVIGRTVEDAVRSPRAHLSALASTAGGAVTLLRNGPLAPKGPFDVPVGLTRRYATTGFALEDARAIERALGGTVNDVILTVLAGGLSSLLRHRGEPLQGRKLRAMMPVSTRSDADRRGMDNRVTTVFVDLPIGPMDEATRLSQVRAATVRLKASSEARTLSAVIDAARFLPPPVHRQVARFGNAHVRLFNLVASNIPGPQVPLFVDGMPLVAYYPLMPLGARTGLSVAVVTLVGVMGFGFTADRSALPDLEPLVALVADAFEALRKAADA
jgi:diacylglycerol O-acyltransferase